MGELRLVPAEQAEEVDVGAELSKTLVAVRKAAAVPELPRYLQRSLDVAISGLECYMAHEGHRHLGAIR